MSDKLKNANSRVRRHMFHSQRTILSLTFVTQIAEAVERMERIESAVLSLTQGEVSYKGQQVVQIATQRRDGMRGVWITIWGADAIKLANGLAEASGSNAEPLPNQRILKGAQQGKAKRSCCYE